MRRRSAHLGRWLGLLVLATAAVGVITAGPAWAATLSANPSTVAAGSTTTLTGTGFIGNETVNFALDNADHAAPAFASATADSNGSFSQVVTIPSGTTATIH